VIAAAAELLEARHYPGVVALASDALEEEPEHVGLLELRARAHIALRRDLEAQADLRDIIRLDPQHAVAYRLLGALAARRDEHESAAIFFREALRLAPDDREAEDWLAIVDVMSRPAAAAKKLPAPAAAAGRFPSVKGPVARARTAPEGATRTLGAPARRHARGTQPPDDDDLTLEARRARGSQATVLPVPGKLALPLIPPEPTPQGPALKSARVARGPVPELPGFGEYLVAQGILTRERLRAAQAYQRSMKVQLATAVVTLGLATEQRIEWAAVAHQARLARPRA